MSTTTKATELSQLAANLTVESGNVGIGTDTPTEKLDVVGNIKTTGSVTASTLSGALTGNAVTATRLETARTINGISFDGSANITLPGTNIAEGTRTTTTVPITSSTGTNATLSAASTTLAGVMTSADKTKLDGIAAGAQVNVATNLTYTTATTTGTVNSSTGTNATIPAATVSLAGLMTNADKTKLDGIAAGAQVNTVTSVAGKTGAVTLVKADVGLSNVDNTSDATKNSATATLTNKTLTNPVINGFTGDTSVINIGTGQVVKDANGNVGIGTSSPASKLHVAGGRLTIDSGGDQYFNIGSSSTASSYGAFTKGGTSTPVGYIGSDGGGIIGGGAGDNFGIRAEGALLLMAGAAEYTRITSAGNVGIGTTAPPRKLVVSNGSAEGVEFGPGNLAGDSAGAVSAIYFNRTTSNYINNIQDAATHQFRTSGPERARIDSSGNLLLGTTSSTNNGLNMGGAQQVNFSGGAAVFAQINNYRSADMELVNRVAGNGISFYVGNGSFAGKFASNGNVGIGTSSPGAKLDVLGTITIDSAFSGDNGLCFRRGFEATENCRISTGDTGFGRKGGLRLSAFDGIAFGTGSNNFEERMRIANNGLVGIGTTPLGDSRLAARNNNGGMFAGTFENHSTTGFGVSIGTASSTFMFFYPNGGRAGGPLGSITHDGVSVSFNQGSDYRLKENIVDAPLASDDIRRIQVRSFNWKIDGSHQKYGMIAQELETVAPHAVTKGQSEEDMWGVDYSKLVPMLVKSIQEQQAIIEELKSRIELLESR